jgi:hypothetical protein
LSLNEYQLKQVSENERQATGAELVAQLDLFKQLASGCDAS